MALSADKDIKRRGTMNLRYGVKGLYDTGGGTGSNVIFKGAAVVSDPTYGGLLKVTPLTGQTFMGIATQAKTLVNGAVAGRSTTIELKYEIGGLYCFKSSGTNVVTVADIGKVALLVDDETVTITADEAGSGGNDDIPIGIVEDVDTEGVWVDTSRIIPIATSVRGA